MALGLPAPDCCKPYKATELPDISEVELMQAVKISIRKAPGFEGISRLAIKAAAFNALELF